MAEGLGGQHSPMQETRGQVLTEISLSSGTLGSLGPQSGRRCPLKAVGEQEEGVGNGSNTP